MNRVYWDSCTYLDFLKGDHPLHENMLAVLKDWQDGKVTLVTSALTIAEVLWVRCDENQARSMLPRSREKEIRGLFEPQPPADLILVELSRLTAEHARELVWRHGVRPKDAVHIASALEARCQVLHTNDKGLQSFNERLGGDPVLKITDPLWQRQVGLDEVKPADDGQPS